jgi:hypothetical protein
VDQSPPYPIIKTSTEDKRKTVRYLIGGTVQFQWLAVNGRWESCVGSTRDIGKSGLFVETKSVPPVSSSLKLIVSLPAGWNKDIVLRLGGTGYVRHIRQEPSEPSGFGAAAVFHVEVPPHKGKAQESQ